MRLSPPIAIMSLIAASLAVLAINNADGEQNWTNVHEIEIDAAVPRTWPARVGDKTILRSGRISIERTGVVRLTVIEQTLGRNGIGPEHAVKTLQAWSLSAANRAFPIAEQLYPAAINVGDQIGIAAFIEGKGGKDRIGKPTHICAHQMTDIYPDSITFKTKVGTDGQWTATPAFCVDSYSQNIRSQIRQIRQLALSALDVDIDAEMAKSQ